jgi:hypothetical protein
MQRWTWAAGLLGITVAVAFVGANAPMSLEARGQQSGRRAWHVRAGAHGDGSAARPFGRLGQALVVAAGGDEVLVHPGTYDEPVRTVRGGTAAAPLVIRAADPARRPVVAVVGRVATVAHPHIVLDGFVLDGGYGNDDAVRVASGATGLVLRNLEVRRTSHDCVDMAAPADVLIERVVIHHCLNATGGRKDAHGIAASAVERLTIRDSEIHTFSGDALQFDPSRAAPGWTNIRLERLKLWLAPLAAPSNGFAAGVVPGENAIDTKTPREGRRASLIVEDVEAWGFRGGLIANMAAFNIKERVDATFDRVHVHHSDIGFRLRGRGDGGVSATIRQAVIHHVGTGIRYEDDVALLRVHAMTVGREVRDAFRRVTSPTTRVDVRDLLVLGRVLPAEAAGGRGRLVGPEAFVNAATDDYRLSRAPQGR